MRRAAGRHHARHRLVKNLGDQRALARTADACDANQHAQGEACVDTLQVVETGVGDLHPTTTGRAALSGDGHFGCTAQVRERP